MKLIIPLAIFAALAGPARADGFKDGEGDVAPRVNLYQKAAAKQGWWSDCGRRITAKECYRIQMKSMERELERDRAVSKRIRREQADREHKARKWADDERRYTKQFVARDVERRIGRCGGEIEAQGKKMWRISGIEAAKREARLQWEREASQLGERYADPAYAEKNGDGYTCWKAGGSNRCTFTARPCRAGS